MTTNQSKKIKLLPRLLFAVLLMIISFQAVGLIVLLAAPTVALAGDTPNTLTLEVPIPGLPNPISFPGSTAPIAQYIKAVYNYAVGAVGVLAAVVLMIGGLMWITAGGSSDRIGEAKAMITASLTGLVLALTSYLILSQVNPALVNLSLDVSSITPFNAPDNVTESLNTCDWKTQSACTLSQGVINSPDSACAGKDKSGVTSPTCCCSYNPAPNQNCKWSPSKCAASESMMNDPSGQLNEKAIKTCGSTENPNYCCCPGAAGCPADPKITCQSCPTCVRLSPNFCVVSSIRNCGVVPSFAEKIYNAHNAANLAGLNWEVTEAWPPTVNHSSPGHANGNSIDLAPIPRTIDKDTVAEIYVNLTETFGNSNVVYECYNPPTPPATDCCTDYRAVGVNCNHYETGVAAGGNNHFHVNN